MCGASRYGRLLRGRRADAPPRAAGQARRGRGLRPAGGGHHRVLRGAPLRRVLRHPGRAGAPAVPGGDLPAARLRGLHRDVQARDGPRARARSTPSRSPASTRPTSTSPGIFSPRAAMRRLISEIKADTGLDCSVGIGPNRLVAKVASDAEKPEGFVVLTREQACKRFAGAAPRLLPGIGAKTAERLEALGIETIAQLAATPPETLAERFGGRLGPVPVRPRALRGRHARSRPSASRSPSRARRPSRPTSPTAPSRSPSCGGSRTGSARGSPSTTGAGARSRSRCASTTSRPSPAPARSRRRRTTRPWWPTSPARCSTSTRRRGRCGCSACAWRRSPSRRRGERRRRAPAHAVGLGLGPIAPGNRDPCGCTMSSMTDTRTASQIITDEVTSWPGVEAGIGTRGEYGFTLGKRQLGHLHGDYVAHFGFPKPVWEELYAAGRITYHPVFPDKKGWAVAPDRERRGRPRRDRDAAPQLRPRDRPHGCRARSEPVARCLAACRRCAGDPEQRDRREGEQHGGAEAVERAVGEDGVAEAERDHEHGEEPVQDPPGRPATSAAAPARRRARRPRSARRSRARPCGRASGRRARARSACPPGSRRTARRGG